MTRITREDIFEDEAVLNVWRIINSAGARAEIIKNDCGEDLIIQSQNNNRADNFSILIQVKGRVLKADKNNRRKISLDLDHIHRWVSHMQPVLVCVYDKKTDEIFAFYPRSYFSLWDIATSNKKTITVTLSQSDRFDKETAVKFIWKCRIEYFSRMISWYDGNKIQHLDAEKSAKRLERIENETNLVALNFLESIGLIEDTKINSKFLEMVENCTYSFSEQNKQNSTENLDLKSAFMLSLLGFVDQKAQNGLPLNLLERGTNVIGVFYKKFYKENWVNLERIISLAI